MGLIEPLVRRSARRIIYAFGRLYADDVGKSASVMAIYRDRHRPWYAYPLGADFSLITF